MFKIGTVEVENRLILAPMEDVTALPMRLIAKRIANPGLLFTEFVSAMANHYNPARARKKMRVHSEERPLAIQIFGGEPETMAEAARAAEEMGADTIDINMGCWVPKVCRTGAGAALLKDPDLAEQIVASVVKSVRVPVTVKVRAGWDYSLFAAPDLVRRFQDAGAQMITLHARFAKQGFEGEADWDLIKQLREVVRVPLAGNGDVKTPADAIKMRRETGCDAVMVGRAAISNPWRLRDIRVALDAYERGEAWDTSASVPSLRERVETALKHVRLMVAFEADCDSYAEALDSSDFARAELTACRALRGQMPLYIKGEPGASQIRDRLTRCSSVAEYEDVLSEFALARA